MRTFKASRKSCPIQIKPIHSAILLAFFTLGTGAAKANCTGLVVNAVSCSSPPTDTGTKVYNYTGTGTATATLTDWAVNAGGFQLFSSAGGNIDVNATNVTVTNGLNAGNAIIEGRTSAAGGNTSMTINNLSLQGGGTGNAVAASAGYPGGASTVLGDSLITASNVNITFNGTQPLGAGLHANTVGTGKATVDLRSGNVTVGGTSVHGVLAHSGSGNVKITTVGGQISTSGAGGYGIYGYTGSSGEIIIDNSDIITTSSTSAHGIYATLVNGTADVTNRNTIHTTSSSGFVANGILVQSTGTGNATITNFADITIDGSGTIMRIENAGGNATINQSGGNIVVNGGVGNGAIYAASGGAGTSAVTMSGGTLSNNSTVASGHGLEAKASGSGNASVTMTAGTVTTQGGLGVVAWDGGTGTGNAKVTTAAGTIINALGSTNSAEGIYAKGRQVNIDSRSAITANAIGIEGVSSSNGTVTITQTNGSVTAKAFGIRGNSAGVVTINNNGGNIQTSGANGYGIWGISTGSTVHVTNRGSSATTGQGAHAIFVQSNTGLSTIDNYAILDTVNNDSKGIAANYSGTSGGITANHHTGASITTHGGNSSSGGYSLANGSAGILLSTTPAAVGDLLAIVDGNITTYGANRAGGVFINNVGTGNATIYATGNILTAGTTGPFSYGLSANIGNQTTSRGDASIYYTNAAGTVETRATDSAALYTYIDTNANGNVRIENAGTLKTSGNGLSPGIWARVLHGSGNATVVNTGAIATTGAITGSGSPSGIRIDTQTGSVDLTNTGAITTQGASASGIRISTANAPLTRVANTGAIATAGASAHGINLFATSNGLIDLASSGTITTSGGTLAGAILINTTNAHISTDISGSLTTAGTVSPAIELISSRNAEGTASNLLSYHDGTATIGAGSNALSLSGPAAPPPPAQVKYASAPTPPSMPAAAWLPYKTSCPKTA